MKGAIRQAERVCLASLLNALVSSQPPPPTRPVVCMNYSSICHKQLGNYDYDDRINNSDCENAERWEQGGVYRDVARLNSVLFMLLVLYAVFLHFFSVSLYPGLLYPPPRVPLKDIHKRSAAYGGDSGGPA